MKNIITILLLFIVTVTYSQSKVTKDTIYNDGKESIKQMYNDAKSLSPKIESALSNLATSLKTTADSVWFIIVRQQVVWSWCFLILTLSSICNWIMFYKRNFTKLKPDDYIIGKKQLTNITTNPNYSEYGSGDRGKKFFELDGGTEDIIIPIKDVKMSWFKYLHLIICILMSGFSFYHFGDMMTGFLNPEFGALKTIVEVAKNLK